MTFRDGDDLVVVSRFAAPAYADVSTRDQVMSMGWKTDWMYREIFNEVKRIWDRAHREAGG